MATLPERPNLEKLRGLARQLQRGVRTGVPDALARAQLDAADPGYRLSAAQRVVARGYGFASWPRLVRHVGEIAARTWVLRPAGSDASVAERYLRLAPVVFTGAAADPDGAAALLHEHPSLPAEDLAVAAAVGDAAAVQALLAAGADPNAASGPYGWSPLMYLTYARVPTAEDATLACAQALLDAGADANDGRYFLGYPTPFTVLTGVFGDGETDEPVHPHAAALARLLLAAGADPNDGQTLYNRQFADADDFLELLFEHGLGTDTGGVWGRRLPDLTPTPAEQLRLLLHWAVLHDQQNRVRLLAAHGVDLSAPLPAGSFGRTGTPLEVALGSGNRAMADLLRSLGAVGEPSDPVELFLGAAFAGDEATVAATPPEVVARARRTRPGAIVWAAAQHGRAAVELLVRAGFDVDALGRGDIPREQPWQTALHSAVERGNVDVVRALLDLGADPSVPDARFGSTPRDWAGHFGRPELAALFDEPRD